MSYSVAARAARFEQEIKKSRFIGALFPVSSEEDAAVARETLRAEFPDATHHCWAYVLGDPAQSASMRMDDDGEPSGTAGKPILSVLLHKKVGDVLVVVVRYFGGTKLGAGGLVRAYSSTASRVMDTVDVVAATPMREARLVLDYGDEPSTRRWLDERHVSAASVSYSERVEIIVRVPVDQWDALVDELADRTGGRAKLRAV